MRCLQLAAVLVMAGTAANAQGTVDFEIDGRKIHIGASRGCDGLSCVSVSIPGVFEMGPKRRPPARPGVADEPDAAAAPSGSRAHPAPDRAPADSASTAQPPAAAADDDGAPAPAAPPKSLSAVPPVSTVPPLPAPRQEADLTQDPVGTAAPAREPASPSQPPPAPARAETSPLGMWETEDRKGMVRIEACGRNLCGYAWNARSKANGEKVLIDLKAQSSSRWSGQIYDPNTGRTYDSTVTLKEGGTLRVQGCAFGGMFCGGQTWNRAG
ncbi:DUF2147 domain-containing protein [Methylobacterium sp. J-070]|uniref:DUF2147 domain-containing protein n=1 Tax=Methylobacterium sp. J-070 TaxID=2836650 RepID=UPI001FBB803F|nr:DUF2147 domain-containing protein [Methylobacterium sp. J-070]MCJ2050834.1 DUF2147 domain-containing protein [Methylobacterium sp. J-070]